MKPDGKPAQITELMENATNRAANALADILHFDVSIKLEKIQKIDQDNFIRYILDTIYPVNSAVQMSFDGDMKGTAWMLLKPGHENKLLQVVCEQQEFDPKLREEILNEIGNVLLNASVGTMANNLDAHVNYDLPKLFTHPSPNFLIDAFPQKGSCSERQSFLLTGLMIVNQLEIEIYIFIKLVC